MELKNLIQRASEVRAKYAELEKKNCGREWARMEIMNGFVSDVGQTMKIMMAKEGLRKMENIDETLADQLSDCLWSILVLSEKYGIDIEDGFMKSMDKIDKRLTAQLRA